MDESGRKTRANTADESATECGNEGRPRDVGEAAGGSTGRAQTITSSGGGGHKGGGEGEENP